jgi:hypothetical protein
MNGEKKKQQQTHLSQLLDAFPESTRLGCERVLVLPVAMHAKDLRSLISAALQGLPNLELALHQR